MVRINLIEPAELSDQHLIAEYNEILMLFGHVRKHPKIINPPKNYVLGKGHITFFKDKLLYLKKRHIRLAKEMVRRGFSPRVSIDLEEFPKEVCNDWKPRSKDIELIKERISSKIEKKPGYYRKYGKKID